MIYNPTRSIHIFALGQANIDDLEEKFASYPCINFDKDGFMIDIRVCSGCGMIMAGRLDPQPTECFKAGGITIKADVVSMNMYDAPYAIDYVLTSGNSLNILSVSGTPEFTVNQLGSYRIHAVIVNPSEVAVSRFSNLYDLMSKLKMGGGKYCGFVELSGATFDVNDCK
ncbi:MAG: hypothetical protein IPO07_01130 [Haliscomenobacter sp.]|nr:hypothetical protein [Haliscomenobacter sp.]MBK9487531.1 hypothetical protein [Haliscomenobacter sp.]